MSISVIDTPDNYHQLDHLIPLCYFLNAKLLVRDPNNRLITEKYYPKLLIEDIISLDDVKDKVARDNKYLIHSFFWPKELFRSYFQGSEIKSIYTPHGNSDKHSGANWMSRFAKQEFCLIYGLNMINFLREEQVFLSRYAYIGNLRYKYYQKHQAYFYENYSKALKTKLDTNKKTILYAPTKKDESMLSSFNAKNNSFFENLASEFNLIIKLHPHFIQNYPEIVYPFFGKMAQKALIIEESPLIYPLLNICDALITDYSSIGYDFLTFNRPLFFLQTDKKDLRSTYLHNSGVVLDQQDLHITKKIKAGLSYDSFAEKRKNLYQYTFHSKPTLLKAFAPSSKGGRTKTE